MSDTIKAIPSDKQHRRGWKVSINGKSVRKVRLLELINQDIGVELRYGLTLSGWDGWAWHERGGGGSSIMPFFLLQGDLFVGVISEFRPLQGGFVLNVPRGFCDPHETHLEAAVREGGEELGIQMKDRILDLGGDPVNWNSAFYDTSIPGEGAHFFAFPVTFSEIDLNVPVRTFRPGIATPKTSMGEKILGCCFIPIDDALALGDAWTICTAARLQRYLRLNPEMKILVEIQHSNNLK